MSRYVPGLRDDDEDVIVFDFTPPYTWKRIRPRFRVGRLNLPAPFRVWIKVPTK